MIWLNIYMTIPCQIEAHGVKNRRNNYQKDEIFLSISKTPALKLTKHQEALGE